MSAQEAPAHLGAQAVAARSATREKPVARDATFLAAGLLAFSASLLAGVAQIALLRELSAHHALSTLGIGVRLVLAVVLCAHGAGAALATRLVLGRADRVLLRVGVGTALYLVLLLWGLLRWLEPGLAADAVTPLRLLLLGVVLAPPFAGYGLAVAHAAASVQARTPARLGRLVALALAGTGVGIGVSHYGAPLFGVNALLLAVVVATPLALAGRGASALALALGVCLLPLEAPLEGLRQSRPAFHPPVDAQNTTRVYAGWSPYQKVDLYTFSDDVLLGFYNGFWQWWAAPDPDHAHAFPGYDVLYRGDWVTDRDVLVIGSGAGMGLLHLERARPRSLLALEMDPLVVELMRGRFASYADHVYDRVPVEVMEGRAYLDATDRRFDLLVYEGSFLTAAHPQVAVSAENHLYTREGIARALERLRPDGVALVLFAGPERALARVAQSVAENGASMTALHLRYPGTLWWDLPVLVFGRDPERVEAVARGATRAPDWRRHVRRVDLASASGPPLRDARPFLYAEGGILPPLLLAVAACVAGLAFGLRRASERRHRGYFFLLGVAFMLVEYALLAQLRSLFGDPVSTAFVASLLLLAGMALGSSAAKHVSIARPAGLALGGLAVGCVAFAGLLALPDDLALRPLWLRTAWVGALLLPLGAFMGVLFPLGLRGRAGHAVPSAYGFDALGAVCGFFAFHALAMFAGIPHALVAGMLVYGAALGLLPRATPA